MQDLRNEDGKFLSLDEFNGKFGLKANYLQYFQITAAIPSSLKQAALLTPICCESVFNLENNSPTPRREPAFKNIWQLYILSLRDLKEL